MKSLIKGNKLTLVLTVLLAVFIVVDVTIPEPVADVVDSINGKSLVILVSVSLLGVDMLLGTVGIIMVIYLFSVLQRQALVWLFNPVKKIKLNI